MVFDSNLMYTGSKHASGMMQEKPLFQNLEGKFLEVNLYADFTSAMPPFDGGGNLPVCCKVRNLSPGQTICLPSGIEWELTKEVVAKFELKVK